MTLRKLRKVFTRPGQDSDEELRFHLEKEVEKNMAAGLSAHEARRQALIAFGGVTATDPMALIPAVTNIVNHENQDLALFCIATQEQAIDKQVFAERITAQLSGFFDVVGLVLTKAVGLIVAGAITGIAVALGVTRFLSSLLYGVKAGDPVTLVAVAFCWRWLLSPHATSRRVGQLKSIHWWHCVMNS
ncbi:MAG: hypothetical protein JWM08_2211 [Candidatus Angelobacter sp.]|nr:hypothetical protein [Candidatus Angelobacter sp.]